MFRFEEKEKPSKFAFVFLKEVLVHGLVYSICLGFVEGLAMSSLDSRVLIRGVLTGAWVY